MRHSSPFSSRWTLAGRGGMPDGALGSRLETVASPEGRVPFGGPWGGACPVGGKAADMEAAVAVPAGAGLPVAEVEHP